MSPNAITAVSVAAVFVALFLGWWAQFAAPADALMARVALAVCIVLYAVLDLMDGQHARNTGQTSKLGEMLDHCTDAVGVPICSLVASWTLCHDQVRWDCWGVETARRSVGRRTGGSA